MATDHPEVEGKRAEKTVRSFLNADGESSPRARLDSVKGRVQFTGTSEVLDFNYDDLSPEVARAAALFGIMTSVTNTVGKAGMTTDEMVEAAQARLDTILEGSWSAERQSGPRTNDLLEAATRYYAALNRPFSDEDKTELGRRLADEDSGDGLKKKLLAVDAFKAHYEAIKAERAAQRAAKAKAAAEATQEEAADLLNL